MSNRLTVMFQCSDCGKFAEASKIPVLPFFDPHLPKGWTGSRGKDQACLCRRCSESKLLWNCNKALCLVVDLHDRKSKDNPYTYTFIQTEDQLNRLLSHMKAKPSRFGIVLEQGTAPIDAGRITALLAFILNVVPEGIDHVVCARPSWLKTGLLQSLGNAGVAVLWDYDHISQFEPVLPNDLFRSDIKTGSFWEVVPDDVKDYLAFLTEYEKDRAIMRALDREFGSSSRDLDEEIYAKWEGADLSALIDAMSFGSVRYEQVGKSGEDCLVKWARPLVEERFFCWRKTYTDEFRTQLKTIEDVFHIWKDLSEEERDLSEFKPHPDMSRWQIAEMEVRGEESGIKHSINALLAGVPVEDILAA